MLTRVVFLVVSNAPTASLVHHLRQLRRDSATGRARVRDVGRRSNRRRLAQASYNGCARYFWTTTTTTTTTVLIRVSYLLLLLLFIGCVRCARLAQRRGRRIDASCCAHRPTALICSSVRCVFESCALSMRFLFLFLFSMSVVNVFVLLLFLSSSFPSVLSQLDPRSAPGT
jgi:hypothetical protein